MKRVIVCGLTSALLARASAFDRKPMVLATIGVDPPVDPTWLTIRDEHGMSTPAMVAVSSTVADQVVEFGRTPLRSGIHKRRWQWSQ